MGTIRINDLKLRAIIGTHSWERVNRQDVVANITIEYDASNACKSDVLKDALDYQTLTAKVIKMVERSDYLLLEKLTAKVMDLVMTDKRVQSAYVRLDKPHAIPEARCVSFELSAQRVNS